MSDIECLDNEQREGMEKYQKTNLKEASTMLFSAFSGKKELVSMSFANYLTDVVVDRFGNKIRMKPLDDENFTITVNVEVNPQFYGWIFGLGKGVKILSPDWIVERMYKHLTELSELYQSDKKT